MLPWFHELAALDVECADEVWVNMLDRFCPLLQVSVSQHLAIGHIADFIRADLLYLIVLRPLQLKSLTDRSRTWVDCLFKLLTALARDASSWIHNDHHRSTLTMITTLLRNQISIRENAEFLECRRVFANTLVHHCAVLK